ncbi:MAG: hypothetical protein E7552_01950 [Ruminococcaceae bacterium]|nr:hypothetical protein [Oscillospiraceae bacterium]
MFQRLGYAIARFMQGRYGVDALQKALLWVYCGVIVLNLFAGSWMLMSAEFVLIGFWLFRTLSRNIPARMRENEWYLKRSESARRFGKLQKNRWRDRKTHVYRTCPHCKATVRLSKANRGRHACDCPRCRKEFSVRI